MADYLVIKGKDRATIEIAQETKVIFPFTFNVVAVKATSGSVTVSLSAGAQSGDDGTDTIAEGDSTVFAQFTAKEIYISGSGTVKVWAGVRPEFCPFSKGGKGGGSGSGVTKYKGTTTTPISNGSTTNPIVIDGEDYTAVFGDIVVYGYTEFVFDGTQWSEFGRPFDTVPTSGSANAVTSDGIYKLTPSRRGTGDSSAILGSPNNKATATNSVAEGSYTTASGQRSHVGGADSTASGLNSFAYGQQLQSTQENQAAFGRFNKTHTGDLFNIGNGTSNSNRSNIVEVNSTELNVNGEIKKNGVSLPTPYTTMPTITESMLGRIAMYVGETTNDYVKGYFYIASSDGAAEPTYSWVSMVDNTPTSESKNFVTSDGIYKRTPWERGTGAVSAVGGSNSSANGTHALAYGYNAVASGAYSVAIGFSTLSNKNYLQAFGFKNQPKSNDLFEIGNGNANARSNIVEVTSTEMNVNGDIQRNGVGIDDYTTTERKIGKWIDGSDLYQRTFDNVAISNNNDWNENVLGTSGIEIVDVKGLCKTAIDTKYMYPLNYYRDTSITICTCINSDATDINIRPCMPSELAIIAVRITIQYTKPSQANLMQTTPTEVSETPTTVEEDDMR